MTMSLSLLTISAPGQSQVHISSLALLKMLKHGRAGVPMEVGEPGCLWWPFCVLIPDTDIATIDNTPHATRP